MAFSFGFYNSKNHDRRYDAVQMARIFDGIILDGVYMTIGKQFSVIEIEGMDNAVVVRSGRAWFNHTWNYNDADLLLEGPAPEFVLKRIDAIVIDIDSSAARVNSLKWVTGVPSSTDPQKPIMIHTEDHNQYALAYIYRPPNTPGVTQGNITNAVGTSETPFVTGVLQGMDIDNLILQWEAQWTEFYNEQTEKMEDTTEYWKEQWESWYLDYTITSAGQFTDWMTNQKNVFNVWFSGVQDVLDENTAGHLASEITNLDIRVTSLEEFREGLREDRLLVYSIDDQNENFITDSDGNPFDGVIVLMIK